jgi:hypothetical protein
MNKLGCNPSARRGVGYHGFLGVFAVLWFLSFLRTRKVAKGFCCGKNLLEISMSMASEVGGR